QCPVDSRKALQGRTSGSRAWIGPVRGIRRSLAKLCSQFRVAGLEQSDQRAVAKRSTHRLDFGKLVAAAEDFQKLRALCGRAAERPPLVEEDAPRPDRQKAQDDEDRDR